VNLISTPTVSLKINEIFYSIQGESTHAGRPCVFVRLMGCPLRCTYCDTEYAFFEGKSKNFDDIFSEIEKYSCKLVEVTGGEPLAQKNSRVFLNALVEKGYEVLLETSGAYPIWDFSNKVNVILDIKTPGSGENDRMCWDNLGHLVAKKDEVKFVVTSHDDFEYAVKISHEKKLFERGLTVLLSPSFGKVSNQQLAEWVLDSHLPFRFQVQLHKYIWSPEKRGV
jgi:7-carboxy-7-deazaguanine synthase